MSITLRDGKPIVLFRCHAGCDQKNLVSALKGMGLWPGQDRDGQATARRVVAEFPYRDVDGKLIYVTERVEPGKGGRSKDFRFKHPAPDGGGWHWGLGGKKAKCGCPKITQILYRLPGLLSSASDERVFIPEGERKVDRLRSLGVAATCNSGGAGKWPNYCGGLKGRRVVILPDHDNPGRSHARDVARRLAGVAAEVRILQLPEIEEKGDILDWLDLGHGVDELLVLADSTPILELHPDTGDGEAAASVPKASDLDSDVPSGTTPKKASQATRLVQMAEECGFSMPFAGCPQAVDWAPGSFTPTLRKCSSTSSAQ